MGLNLLVVDDDAATRGALRKALSRSGHQVDLCEDATAALSLLDRTRFDTLLTDYMMPGMNGVELSIACRAKAPTVRCVVMSGVDRPEDAPPWLIWLTKPIELESLFKAIGAE
jgi:DNA-binding response OmpR family regulator